MHANAALKIAMGWMAACALAVTAPARAESAADKYAWLMDSTTCPAAVYPPQARRNAYTGTVVLSMLIDVQGTVTETQVSRSTGHAELDDAAQALLSQCRFRLRPPRAGVVTQRPTEPVWQKVAYVWKLEDGKAPGAAGPDLHNCPPLIAPEGALAAGQTATVKLTYLIKGDGAVVKGIVTGSSGNPALDQVTLDGVAKCPFVPVPGAPADAAVWIPVDYVWHPSVPAGAATGAQ